MILDWYELQIAAFEELTQRTDLNPLQRAAAEDALVSAKQDLEDNRRILQAACGCGQPHVFTFLT